MTEGTLLEEELKIIFSQFAPLIPDVESRKRVKRCSLVPVSVVVAACQGYGRCRETISLLTSLHQLPRVWELAMEQDANHARLEHDYALEEELEELEEEGVHLAAELSVMHPYQKVEEDEQVVEASWRLPSVPASLKKELETYATFRAEPLNRFRDGSAVVDVTVGNDRATVLRFLGYLSAEKGIPPVLAAAFGNVHLSAWAEEWTRSLQEKGVQFSSLSNYVNSLISVTKYVYSILKIDDSIQGMLRTPLDELLSLRGQCESEAKQQRLWKRRDPNWIDFPVAQEARRKAELAYRTKRNPQNVRDWLIISLHTVMPPDRCVASVIRIARSRHMHM